jgi:hypothetical protein
MNNDEHTAANATQESTMNTDNGMLNESTTIEAGLKLNRSQCLAVNRIEGFYNDCYDVLTDKAVVSVSVESLHGLVFVIARTTRTDCHEHSQRALFCERHSHCAIGRRGAIKVLSAEHGLSDEKPHLAQMVRGKVNKLARRNS